MNRRSKILIGAGVIVAGLSVSACGQAVNPGRVNVVTTPWSVNWLTHANDAAAMTDLGVDAAWQDILDGTAATLANVRTIAAETGRPVINVVTDYGVAVAPADSSTEMQAAITAAEALCDGANARGPIVYIPPGDYVCEVVVSEPITIWGMGAAIQAVNNGNYAITFTASTQGYFQRELVGVTFDGDGQTKGGVHQNSGSLVLRNCLFNDCMDGVYTSDVFDLHVRDCIFWGCDYGLRGVYTGVAQDGCKYITDSHFIGCDTAGLYLKGRAEGTYIKGGIVEQNPGFGLVFIDVTSGVWTTAIAIDDVWFEGNGEQSTGYAGNVTIDANSISPLDMYVEGTHAMTIRNTGMPNVWLKNSHLKTEHCGYYGGYYPTGYGQHIVELDTLCTVLHKDLGLHRNGGTHVNDFVEGVRVGPYPGSWLSYAMDGRSQAYNLFTNGACQGAFTPYQTGGMSYSWVHDPCTVSGGAVEVTLTASMAGTPGTSWIPWNSFSRVAGKWYVFSFAVKGCGSAGILDGGGYGFGQAMADMEVDADTWRTYAGIAPVTSSASGNYLYFWNAEGSDLTLRFADGQMVACDTMDEALEYVNAREYARSVGVPVTYYDDDPNDSATVTITIADNGKWFSNSGALAACEFDLPAATIGQRYGFIRMASYSVKIDPSGTEYFRPDAGAGDYLELDTNGDTVQIACFQTGVWDVIAGYGTYAWEP